MSDLNETVGFFVIGRYAGQKQSSFHPNEEAARRWITGFLEHCKTVPPPTPDVPPFVVMLPGITFRGPSH